MSEGVRAARVKEYYPFLIVIPPPVPVTQPRL